ncbi:MAG: protein serine/threonine phosphatase [Bacteroidetes bacterium]|jgi:tetratricopeptide (TPR) repeat protein|nr:protein serine/threonine phosphatase [Bacteroidota bacterium]
MSKDAWRLRRFDVPRAIELAREALRYSKNGRYELGEGFALRTLGVAHFFQEQYRNALPELEKAKIIFLKHQYYKGISSCYRNIGNIYTQTSNYDKAQANYERAIDYARKLDDELSIAYSTVNLGLIEHLRGNYKGAISILTGSLETVRKFDDKNALTEIYFNLGNNYLQDGNLAQAEDFLNQSLHLSEELEYVKGVSQAYTILGTVYYRKGNVDQALKYMHEGIASALELNEKRIASDTYKTLAEVYKSIGNYQKAFECYEQYDEMRKRLQIHDHKSLVDSMHGELEIEKYAREVVESKNKQIEDAYELIKQKNKDITDSIRYARHIQQSLLPSDNFISESLSQHMIFYQPREIVSGDFYWFNQKNGLAYFATVDCTGHGVPGAFISIVSCNCLYQAFRESDFTEAGKMLDRVHELFNMMIRQTYEESAVKDGMDISLCIVDPKKGTINFAGANHDLHIVRDGEMMEIRGDKNAIGIFIGDEIRNFTSNHVQMLPNDCVYMFTDGYADQFGGKSGEKKYFRKRLKKFLTSIAHEEMEYQQQSLKRDFNTWKADNEQIDDVLVIGVKF